MLDFFYHLSIYNFLEREKMFLDRNRDILETIIKQQTTITLCDWLIFLSRMTWDETHARTQLGILKSQATFPRVRSYIRESMKMINEEIDKRKVT